MKLPPPSKYPKKVWIKDSYWKVKFAKTLLKDPLLLGLCDFETQTIWIKRGQSPKETLKTYIHELFHSLEHCYNLKIKHSVIHEIEEGVANLLLDNF